MDSIGGALTQSKPKLVTLQHMLMSFDCACAIDSNLPYFPNMITVHSFERGHTYDDVLTSSQILGLLTQTLVLRAKTSLKLTINCQSCVIMTHCLHFAFSVGYVDTSTAICKVHI